MSDSIEQRLAQLEGQVERLEAMAYVQTADVSALQSICSEMSQLLRKLGVQLPEAESAFLQRRKAILQRTLEILETSQPGRAARLQELIEKSSVIFPFKYDDTDDKGG
jgi:hypothetical protein